MNTITVVTTFNDSGYNKYGRRMIQTFLNNWPNDVQLLVYAEECEVIEQAENLVIYDLDSVSSELVTFKKKWSNVPKANGQVATGPAGKKGKQPGIGFKWDAVRFSHKVYSIFHAAKNTQSEKLIWMDADMVCHSPITKEKLISLCPDHIDLAFLGRQGKYTECGLYYMNLISSTTREFLSEFQSVYDNAESGIFQMSEWHDSFVFDQVKSRYVSRLVELDWSEGLIKGEGHPLINSEWGAYLDHLKGNRKDIGKSKPTDLRVERMETYWQ